MKATFYLEMMEKLIQVIALLYTKISIKERCNKISKSIYLTHLTT